MSRRLLSLLASFCLSAGCGGPTAPSASKIASVIAGVWEGRYRVSGCGGDRHCGAYIGEEKTFVLRVEQAGPSVTGVLVLVQPPADAYYHGNLAVYVTGAVNADGMLTVNGLKPALSASDSSGEVELQYLTLKTTGNALTGALAFISRYVPFQNPETSMRTLTGDVLSATRDATLAFEIASPFQGHWSGRQVIRTCTEPELLVCRTGPDSFSSFVLTLSQSGNVVVGSLGAMSMNGTASSTALRLEGLSTPLQVSGGFITSRITDWSTTVDPLGQMQGSYTFIRELHLAVGGVLTTTIVYDLVSVVLVP
jgi:hypothetical protein